MLTAVSSYWVEALGTLGVGLLTWMGVKLKTMADKAKKTNDELKAISKTTKDSNYELKNDHGTNIRDDIDKNTSLTEDVAEEVKRMSGLMSDSLLRIDTRISGMRDSLNKEIQERQTDIKDVRDDIYGVRDQIQTLNTNIAGAKEVLE